MGVVGCDVTKAAVDDGGVSVIGDADGIDFDGGVVMPEPLIG